MQIMAHLLKDLLLIAIYNIRHVFCNNSMPIKAYKILTREVTVLDSKNNRARGRLTRRCNIPEEGSFCILKYRANVTQDLSFFISFPSKFLSLFCRTQFIQFRYRWRSLQTAQASSWPQGD